MRSIACGSVAISRIFVCHHRAQRSRYHHHHHRITVLLHHMLIHDAILAKRPLSEGCISTPHPPSAAVTCSQHPSEVASVVLTLASN